MVELVNSDVPMVTIDHVFNNRMAVLSDNVNGLSALVRYAYANGHRRIAFIHGERTAVTENRLAGFYKSCAELGLQVLSGPPASSSPMISRPWAAASLCRKRA